MRPSSQSVSRANPSGCCAPRRSDTITVGTQYFYRCPTRSPSDCRSPRRPRDISGGSSWPGLLRSRHSGYRPATRCHTITLSASGTALAVLEDWDPRRPASWIGVLLRGGRDTTWSLVLIPIDLATVDIGRFGAMTITLGRGWSTRSSSRSVSRRTNSEIAIARRVHSSELKFVLRAFSLNLFPPSRREVDATTWIVTSVTRVASSIRALTL